MEKRKKLLVVEDEAITAMLLVREMQLAGYDVGEPVATGEAAVAVSGDSRFDAVLMDVRLAGDMDGIQAAEKIQSREATPIVFISGYSDSETKERIEDFKPAGFLEKPVRTERVLAVLNLALS